MGNTKAVRNAINRTFSAKGGVFWNDVRDSQLNEYWLKILDAYLNRPVDQQNIKKAALHLGRQEDDIYVIGQGIQLDRHGVLIPTEEQSYIWMAPYLKGLISMSEKSLLKEYTKVTPVPLALPIERFNWTTFMESAREFMGPNFMQFIMLLAGALSAFHYQKVLSVVGSCPAPMAVGETGSGKSTCLQLIHKMLGGSMVSQSSGESVSSELVKSTFPVYWDDPAHPKTVTKVLVSTFQGGGKQTKGSGNEVPLTTFVMTVNFTLDEDMRSFERTTPIVFDKIVTKSVSDTFMKEKKALFDKASTSCLPSVIRMGRELTEGELQQHVSFFREKLVGLPSRLPSIYSSYRFFAKEVIENVNDPDVVSLEELDKHITEKLVPYVQYQYSTTTKVSATIGQLFADLISAVEKTKAQEIHKWIKPRVAQRNGGHGGTALHIQKAELARVLTKAGTPYSSSNFSTLCASINGANPDFRTNFGKPHRELSIKIPRDAVEENHLKTIDSWFGMEPDEQEEITECEVEEDKCENCERLSEEIDVLKRKIEEYKGKIQALEQESLNESGFLDADDVMPENDQMDFQAAETHSKRKGKVLVQDQRKLPFKKKGELEKLGDGFTWFKGQASEASRKRMLKGTRAVATSTSTVQSEEKAPVEKRSTRAKEKRGKRQKLN